jgi:hypothetical protein
VLYIKTIPHFQRLFLHYNMKVQYTSVEMFFKGPTAKYFLKGKLNLNFFDFLIILFIVLVIISNVDMIKMLR